MANGYPDPQQPSMFPPSIGQGLQGMFGGLKRGYQAGNRALHPYSNRLLLAGMGLLSRDKDAMGQAMKGLVAGSALDTEDADRRKLNEAIQGLMNDTSGEGILSGISGPERDYLLASPSTLSKVLADRMSPPSAGVSIYAGDYKVPTNYQRVDPNDPSKGVERIPGVLTDTQVNDLSNAKVRAGSIEGQLKRYEDLVGKYGIEMAPGIAKTQMDTVRQSIMLEMKELVGLGVLNGPDLDIMNKMIWDPSVDLGGGIGNVPGQVMTVFSGNAKERAKASADELRMFMKNKIDAYNQKLTGNEPPPTLEQLNEIYGVD